MNQQVLNRLLRLTACLLVLPLAAALPASAEHEYVRITNERVDAALAPGADKEDIRLAEASLAGLGWLTLYGNDSESQALARKLGEKVADAYNGTPRMSIYMDHTSEYYGEMLNLGRFDGDPIDEPSEYVGITRRRVDEALAPGAGNDEFKLAEGSLCALGWLVTQGNGPEGLALADELMNAAFEAWPAADGIYMDQTSTAYAEMINLGRFEAVAAVPAAAERSAPAVADGEWTALSGFGPGWTPGPNPVDEVRYRVSPQGYVELRGELQLRDAEVANRSGGNKIYRVLLELPEVTGHEYTFYHHDTVRTERDGSPYGQAARMELTVFDGQLIYPYTEVQNPPRGLPQSVVLYGLRVPVE